MSSGRQAVALVWTESGGPKVKKPTGPGGYGSKLVERSVTGHLKGAIDYGWADEGPIVTLRVIPTTWQPEARRAIRAGGQLR